jgi:hypothetical protein
VIFPVGNGMIRRLEPPDFACQLLPMRQAALGLNGRTVIGCKKSSNGLRRNKTPKMPPHERRRASQRFVALAHFFPRAPAHEAGANPPHADV